MISFSLSLDRHLVILHHFYEITTYSTSQAASSFYWRRVHRDTQSKESKCISLTAKGPSLYSWHAFSLFLLFSLSQVRIRYFLSPSLPFPQESSDWKKFAIKKWNLFDNLLSSGFIILHFNSSNSIQNSSRTEWREWSLFILTKSWSHSACHLYPCHSLLALDAGANIFSTFTLDKFLESERKRVGDICRRTNNMSN